jgi:hypothetical protein
MEEDAQAYVMGNAYRTLVDTNGKSHAETYVAHAEKEKVQLEGQPTLRLPNIRWNCPTIQSYTQSGGS